ncbi:hypothetical protein CNBJ1600 [Cryptococcus deneoformans B-3501A]|uniref:Mitochondrion protein, putative n=1 Tax=Cryptococcus deneoformans (strain JEC21 / ATCC MYA-565) TaxID=214684 RepID=Q5KAF7_CRYD1|nr:mitochondrion protein, putative [Cryptococcus neoformans var. neoformans JEC21]XP_773165.1 hypothetical protein CNBJ1600 [Cryptococcus neoformans var. neoformans B-3501A]AAW45843.1 mitochondrion protein, putative [Cryptococcus neoformans var. neoformans JEC21]EAL18518.1 hypothetical protein CNBJ1600 [Cryptococcus neoformans var. neoformans B-3501A]
MPFRTFIPGLSLRLRPQVRLQSPRSTKSYTTVEAHIPHGHAHHAHRAQRVPYKKPSALRKWGVRFALAIAFPTTYILGAAFPPQLVLLIFPRFSPPPPHKDSARGKAHTNDVEGCMQGLQLVEMMRKEIQGGAEWYETRPYDKYDPQKVHNSLTAGTLRGPGKLAIPPILFAKKDESEAIAIIHLGRALCGHDGIVHGGLLATVMDETLGRNALLNLPSRIGVTANLNINYRSPCMADQFVVVRTKVVELKGRKCVAEAKMETLSGETVADAKALFIEPKWAQFLASSGVTEAMGRPIPQPENAPGLMDGQVEKIV